MRSGPGTAAAVEHAGQHEQAHVGGGRRIAGEHGIDVAGGHAGPTGPDRPSRGTAGACRRGRGTPTDRDPSATASPAAARLRRERRQVERGVGPRRILLHEVAEEVVAEAVGEAWGGPARPASARPTSQGDQPPRGDALRAVGEADVIRLAVQHRALGDRLDGGDLRRRQAPVLVAGRAGDRPRDRSCRRPDRRARRRSRPSAASHVARTAFCSACWSPVESVGAAHLRRIGIHRARDRHEGGDDAAEVLRRRAGDDGVEVARDSAGPTSGPGGRRSSSRRSTAFSAARP